MLQIGRNFSHPTHDIEGWCMRSRCSNQPPQEKILDPKEFCPTLFSRWSTLIGIPTKYTLGTVNPAERKPAPKNMRKRDAKFNNTWFSHIAHGFYQAYDSKIKVPGAEYSLKKDGRQWRRIWAGWRILPPYGKSHSVSQMHSLHLHSAPPPPNSGEGGLRRWGEWKYSILFLILLGAQF